MVNCQIGVTVKFHDVIYWLWEVWGMGNAPLEAKLLHQMKEMREEVLYKVFLDL